MQLAQSYLQGMASPFDNILGAYSQGQTLRQNSDLLKSQQAEQARKIAAQQALETIDWNDKSAIARIVAQYPEYTKGAKDYYDALEQKEQQALLYDMSTSISALSSDRPDIAVQNMRDKANAYRDAGNEEKAEEYSQMAAWMARDPQGAKRAMQMNYAVLAGDKAVSGYKSFVDADIAENESPYTINEKIANAENTKATAFKNRAEAIEGIGEGLTTAAIGGSPGPFSLKVAMMHAQGLLTDQQKAYIDERLADEDPDAVEAFLDGLAGQNVEIAKLNKPETTVVNAGGQLVAIKKNADGSVEIVGSIDKTLSPDVKYAQDSAGERAQLAAEVSMFNAEQQRLLQKYKIDIDDKNAEKKLQFAYLQEDLKNKKAKLETHGGKVYQVYPDGTAVEARDINGNPIKPTVNNDPATRKAVAEQQSLIDNGQELLRVLRKAKAISDKGLYYGATANTRAGAMQVVGGSDKSDRTLEYDTLITNSALQSMKSIFGGNPTEGEREILLKIQASSKYPRHVRENILNEAIAAAQNRINSSQSQIKILQGGSPAKTPTGADYSSVIEPIKKKK